MTLRPSLIAICLSLAAANLNAQWRLKEFSNKDGQTIQARMYHRDHEAPTLVCADLFNTPLTSWDKLWPYAFRSRFNLIAVDVRGKGDSSKAITEEGSENHATPYAKMHENILAGANFLRLEGYDTSRLGLLCAFHAAGPGMAALDTNHSPFRAVQMMSPMPPVDKGFRFLDVAPLLQNYQGPPLRIVDDEANSMTFFTKQWSDAVSKKDQCSTEFLKGDGRAGGASMFGRIVGAEQHTLDYFAKHLNGEPTLRIPSFAAKDAGRQGFFRKTMNVGRQIGDAYCSLSLFVVDNQLTIGPMAEGDFTGEVALRIGDRELTYSLDTSSEDSKVQVQSKDSETLEGRYGRTAKQVWIHVTVPVAEWLGETDSKISAEFRPADGDAITIPSGGKPFKTALSPQQN